MRKIVTVQVLLLAATVIMGVTLKGDLASEIRVYHRAFALASVLVGIAVVITAFLSKQPQVTKVVSVITLLLTLSAIIGGLSLASTDNYSFAFGQMALSGAIALLASATTFVLTLRNVHSANPAGAATQ